MSRDLKTHFTVFKVQTNILNILHTYAYKWTKYSNPSI